MAPKFITKGTRTFIYDPTAPYPLPVDLAESHRQSLLTLTLTQLYGGPLISASEMKSPPRRVLELGCGSGYWSMMCHQFLTARGHPDVSFVGIDVVVPPDVAAIPDNGMDWTFVEHDMRRVPWPLESGEFDLLMVKDMSLAFTSLQYVVAMEECLRVLKPGGILEMWETDSTIRVLQPHEPKHGGVKRGSESWSPAAKLGAYSIDADANTPLGPPLNKYFAEYNSWVAKALEKRELTPMPCAMVGPRLVQEADVLTVLTSRRLAIPLSEIKWERGRVLDGHQAAVRRTALEIVLGGISALEPLLREVSGKNQDEWEVWFGNMTQDLMTEGGACWGECLEVGAWIARKKDEMNV
ncbi:S-adenosyl-L-methionine-dependent methyltransferase [Pseudomassariella vexata]|uniref:S-adenosyl-L-methionine-dependent methyltransferase n=1 Tax=Pseudomassariella vexata TaxID=1141098 RepID=A0A1Y2E6N4_9PEZI|nr:S-adenosyl-L-methionine-dependent methyltransferase [Pseudomassariella vexata]ORY66525.1 S-adenosyl-L-methionine-dependent methyltransferase [Pseudomassariella vexata]